uniref:Reverse transcriptase zinc-binding domain-containing protein n=1 Tax=Chenopodium quinoa TaxID=63459 RepID=A0A803MS15_CHEQI
MVDIHDRYLGLPTVVGRSKKVITKGVKDKLWKKLQGWKGMSLVAQFWWGQKQGERKIHWLSWKKLCKPKNEGGLGLRDPKLFNWALLGKQAWRLVLKSGTLIEQVLKGRYYPNSSFMEANVGVNPSYKWCGIAETRWVVRRVMRWRIGDGESVRVWTNQWLEVLPRVNVFAWRACQNALPTRCGIQTQIYDYNPECVIYNRGFESTIHALKDCRGAKAI